MSTYDEITQPHIATIESDGRRYNVSCRVGFDGVEYVGRLWFADESWDDLGLPDRGGLPGRTKEEVLALARRLTPEELVKRHRRALSEKRRFHGLRKATDEILAKIRYLNQVAISMRAGLLDVEGAAQEIDLTEKQLHSLIDRLSTYAGIED
ncbi:MAG TPA: hypothetical protein VJL28_09335 [Gemmatimonadaceae bacterium]|nr:hypothetical protein [Gemmatimonadaceae bacterium]